MRERRGGKDIQGEGGREVEAKTGLLALSTPPTGLYFHQMVHAAEKTVQWVNCGA